MKQKKWLPIILLLAFVIAWEAFVIRPYNAKRVKEAPHAQTAQTTDPKTATATAVTGAPVTPGAPTPTLPEAQSSAKPLDPSSAIDFRLGNDKTAKIFSNGAIGNIVNSNYTVRETKERIPVTMMPQGLRWQSTSPDISNCLSSLNVGSENEQGIVLNGSAGVVQCSVQYQRVPPREDLVRASLTVTGAAQGFVTFAGVDKIGEGREADHQYLNYRLNEDNETVRGKHLHDGLNAQGKVEWLVWGDSFFSTILIPHGSFNPNLVSSSGDAEKKTVSFGFQYPIVPAAQPTTYSADLYFGPKDPTVLAALSPTLPKAVDLGIAGSVARFMLWCLKSLNTIFGNFGISIIVLTLLVRVLFWPLNKKVFESSLKMKALQPEIEKIKKKYGTDREKASQMNMELMGLYRVHKVNPMGSCLPILLQMPIFFGLYGALSHSLLLYQAPLMGWITDLSSPDPFYALPILWTITLLAYTWLAPQQATQPGMPDMRWIMLAMNLFFGYLAKDWPAGLNLYLVVSNLVGVTQQFVMQRSSKKLQPVQEGA